ncbi:glycerophosphoryl diester phosphodiesterase membrane domain-containing protein [Glutamicibacter sp. M10]|uniref:glycerophosphoryl diester phosphodiesterase membrane domain-containing protein n=1 Tax=Glutamicibacter sp. M10 TaxID=3023076 RepID=UPI0021C6418A|nr:glycerophosphodiester phosphodiesterase [Glutamicibacter sp. M10]UXN32646.1 glycerophosphodiester phosphodiesterase [Glutamicibacter sp. M10]
MKKHSELKLQRKSKKQRLGASLLGAKTHSDQHERLNVALVLRLLVQALRLSHAHVPRYLGAIILAQAFNGFVVLPAVKAIFSYALNVSDLANLTNRDLPTMLSHPGAALLLLLIAFIVLLALGLQFSVLIVMVNRQQSGLSLSTKEVVRETVGTLWRMVRRPPLPLMLYLIVVLPLGGLGLSSVLIQGIEIPPFVSREYLKTPLSGVGYSLLIAVIFYLNLRLILSLPMFVVGGKKATHAIFESFRATSGNFWGSVFMFGIPALGCALLSSLMVEILIWISRTANTLLDLQRSAFVALVCIQAGYVLGFLLVGVTTVVIIQVLVVAARSQLDLPHGLARVSTPNHTARSMLFMIVAVVVSSLLLAFSVRAVPLMAGTTSKAEDTAILAHRGFSGGGVENTIGGLEAAAKLHPDYVEADFQETKDKHFVASHDTNLLVVAGRNQNIYEMNVDEVTSVKQNVSGFTGTIPTMNEYLNRAKELKTPLLVELKVSGHEAPGFMDRFLKEIDAAGTAEQNIYHSLDPAAVSELKERRPELRVGLTMAMSLGAIPEVECDFIVVEQASFDPELLAMAREADKPVYVWTVNEEQKILELLSLGVDGIVTDSVDVALRDRDFVAENPRSDYRVGVALAHLDLFR